MLHLNLYKYNKHTSVRNLFTQKNKISLNIKRIKVFLQAEKLYLFLKFILQVIIYSISKADKADHFSELKFIV